MSSRVWIDWLTADWTRRSLRPAAEKLPPQATESDQASRLEHFYLPYVDQMDKIEIPRPI
jgi:hypothetical protein